MTSLLCPASLTRGQLKHSWLENQILNKTAEEIVVQHAAGWPALVSEFEERVTQTRMLAEDVEYGFSPAQLIDRLEWLSTLSAEQKGAIKQAVHAAYLENMNTKALRVSLLDAVELFDSALRHVIDEWKKPQTTISESRLSEAWNDLLDSAFSLVDALDQLPREIVLP